MEFDDFEQQIGKYSEKARDFFKKHKKTLVYGIKGIEPRSFAGA